MKSMILSLFLLSAGTLFGAGETLERYALITGSNFGGKGTGTLKYAASDAKRFQDVLTRMGGVKDENTLLMVNPEKDNLVQGLAFLANKIKKNRNNDRQAQFLFYYSGHSDDRGLLLNGERMEYADLKARIDAVGAEVQIVVLDSCSSGAFTRSKGGQIMAPFLMDLSTDVEGHAFLTSSTAEEVSQESDRIGSSFFTHALIEGLRGAADANGDGKVSLNEAYDYAYSQTLADTQRASSGSQHPAFDIKLTGKGNLILTDLKGGGATLNFPMGLAGKVTVRDITNRLIVEVQKGADKELVLGVDEGYYKITLEVSGSLSETAIAVDESRAFSVPAAGFRPATKEATQSRGPSDSTVVPSGAGIRVVDSQGRDQLSLNFLLGKSPGIDGMMLALLSNQTGQTSSGFQGSVFANVAGADFIGTQLALGVNWTEGDFQGVQLLAAFNGVAGSVSGVQVGAVNSIGQTMNLGQLGFVNLLAGNGKYFQIGGWNQAAAELTGLQAGLGNWVQNLTGVQVGLFNYSEEQVGVQIGLINVSKKLTGLPIGLIDIQFNGQNHIDTLLGFTGSRWESLNKDLVSTTVLRFGSEYFYKYFSYATRLAYTAENDTLPAVSLGVGLGFRVPAFFPGFAFHGDVGTTYNRTNFDLDFRSDPSIGNKFVPEFRTFATWTFYQNFGLVAGWDQHIFTKYYHPDLNTDGKLELKTDWANLYVSSRFFLGVQF